MKISRKCHLCGKYLEKKKGVYKEVVFSWWEDFIDGKWTKQVVVHNRCKEYKLEKEKRGHGQETQASLSAL